MKRSFLTGLIILLPLAVTIWLIAFLLDIFSSPFLETVITFLTQFKNIIPLFKSQEAVTIVARVIIIILFCLFILLVGAFSHKFFVRSIVNLGNKILMKIPFIKSIHHTVKDLIDAVVSIDERKAFVSPLMIPFPTDQSMALGFLSGSVPEECQKAVNKKLIPVLMPTAPHPIAGYLLFVPEDKVHKINLTNEDVIKFVLSCGVVTPENPDQPEGKSNEKTTS